MYAEARTHICHSYKKSLVTFVFASNVTDDAFDELQWNHVVDYSISQLNHIIARIASECAVGD